MVDILFFVYENFFVSGIYPSRSVLAERLYAAGFEEIAVDGTLNWLATLEICAEQDNGVLSHTGHFPEDWVSPMACRHLAPAELACLEQDGWEFLAFLEHGGVLTPMQRELILSGLMASDFDEPNLDKVKLLTLMVLWRQGSDPNALLIEELIHLEHTPIH